METQLQKINQSLESQILEIQQNPIFKELFQEKYTQSYKKDTQFKAQYTSNFLYDDFYLIYCKEGDKQILQQNYKISKIIIYHGQNTWPQSLQFEYKNQEGKQILGLQSRAFKDTDYNQQTVFNLDDDEYLISVQHNCCLVIKALRFITSKNREFKYQVDDNLQFQEIRAPLGFHLTNFSKGKTLVSHDNYCISELGADFRQQWQQQQQNSEHNNKITINILKNMRKIIDFLDINDILAIFTVNKQFNNCKKDEYILNELCRRLLYYGKQNSMKFVEQIVHGQEDKYKETIQHLKNSSNLIKEPHNISSYSKSGDVKELGTGFATSYTLGTLTYKQNLKETLDEDIYQKLVQGKYAIVFGSSFKTGGPGGKIIMQFNVLDKLGEIKSSKKLTEDEFHVLKSSEIESYILYYINDPEKISEIYDIQFILSGQDTCFWAGYFGAVISDMYIKLLPIETSLEQHYFSYVIKKEQFQLQDNKDQKKEVIVEQKNTKQEKIKESLLNNFKKKK